MNYLSRTSSSVAGCLLSPQVSIKRRNLPFMLALAQIVMHFSSSIVLPTPFDTSNSASRGLHSP